MAELSEETARLAALGRGEDVPATSEGGDTGAPAEGAEGASEGTSEGTVDVPEWVPEKFRKDGQPDYEALAKAYAELEKKQGQGKPTEETTEEGAEEGAKEGGEEEGEEGNEEEAGEKDPEAEVTARVQKSIADARDEYAASGELSEKTYETLTSMLGQEYVDVYLQGVKALEADLERSVYDLAGGEDSYRAAVEWARENWSEKQVEKFDSALSDPDMRSAMIKGLMADYGSANPGEGTATRPGSGATPQDLYNHPEEFTNDLAAADEANDTLARRKAVQKLERSKKAGTLKGITPRSQSSYLPQG